MKNRLSFSAITAAVLGCTLSSCVYHSNPVPEMPYTRRPQQHVQTQAPIMVQTPAPRPGTWAPAVQQPVAPGYTAVLTPTLQPAPVARPAAQPVPTVYPTTPAPKPAAPKPTTPKPATGSHITQGYTPPAPVVEPAPAPTPAPAVQPPVVTTVTPPTPDGAEPPTDPKLITNTGPIPVATKVEGDPIRVYNPLDPTKTIRIIDPKTGKTHPSGKVLKVKGTNFKFIVP
ncbi:MAG: hypothetical protein IKZ07_06555 [Akkermansia sp.]|nr:hypothetical protein [Akkermansia sp.]